ncbi:discoidin domain-containing protein [Phormidesmis sp. 146-12]
MWRLVAQIEIANQWTWTVPIEGEWFRFEFVDPPGEVRVDITQGNGSAPFATPTRVTTSESQIVRFQSPPATMGDRRLAIRSGDRFFRDYNLGWLVKISVFEGDIEVDGNDYSSALQTLLNGQQEILQQLEAGGIDPAIASNIQAIATGQIQILDRLQQPIQAQIPVSIIETIQATLAVTAEQIAIGQGQILQKQSEVLGKFPIDVEIDPAINAGIQQILGQFPITVQTDPAITNGIQEILGQLTPTPIAALTPITTNFTVSQSSVYGNLSYLTGSFATLTDGNPGTGFASSSGAIEWIQATFATAITCRGIQVGGGGLQNWGGVAAYLNGKQIQWSSNGSDWIVLSDIVRVSDSGPNQFVLCVFPQVTARFFRIVGNSWLSTTEFRFFN